MTTETATPNQADASTAFLRAARAGQIEKIISLLEQGVDINVSNANGLNAIHLASKDGHVEVVNELLQRGAAIDAATKKGNTALHIASLAGQEAVVKLLVQNGAQVNIQSQNGFTPLYMAAQENHDGVVKFLLANGANQSLATEDGFTPLAVAMQQGHEKVVAVLLEADTRGRVRLPALHIAAKKDDVKAATLLLENEHNPDVTSKSGFTPLHIAAHYGNEAVARLLLVKGADVNCPAKHNICPLHVAAKWGKDNMVNILCYSGANIEARTRDGLTPLHCAARSGHERVVEVLVDRGAPITSKSKNGLAPLHMAAQGEHAEAARVLLSRRAPVDDVTVDYLTALHVAAHCGHAKVAKLLLDKNADANARALNGFTPLHIACKKNRIKVVELLLKYGASIQATTESGLTPLHVAAFMGCMNIVIYLLQHEANPDVPTVRGETPLHLAARANQTDIIRILLRNGAAVEAKARERQTPLHIASRLGNVDIAVLLLQHGADVRAQTADHYNALHIAAKQHNHDVAAALIEHGAPLVTTTKKGFTPLHLAAKYGNLKVANLLLAHGASPDQSGKNGVTPLHVAAQYDQQAVATTLMEKGADAKAVAKNGHTPLHIAARKNQMETAAALLEYGAITNAESKAGFTPLHLAAQQGHAEMCSLLMEHGADVNQQSKNGLAALHLASQEDKVPVAQLLIKNGANIDSCTKGGYTPLHVASHYGQTNMVRYLLDNSASVKAQTTHGYTALHHAAQQGHINIVNILLENRSDANAITTSGQTPLDIASKLGYVTIMETLKGVSEPSTGAVTQDKYKVVAPETMLETFISDSEEEVEDTILNDQPYRYLTADDMKSLGDDSLPIDVTRDERADSVIGNKNIMEISQGSMNGSAFPIQEVVVKSVSRYSSAQAPEGYCYNVDPSQPNFLVSFLVDARGGALRGCRGGGVRVIVPPLAAQQPTRITCRYLKPSRINHMPPLMEGEALAARVLEMGPVSAKFLGPVILEVPHFASLRGKEREIVILRSDNGTSWREHNTDATDEVVQDILHETLEIEESNEDTPGSQNPRMIRILTHDFPQYFAVISRIRQEVHAIGPEGGMVSSSVVPQVQAVFPQGALTKKIKVGLQAQIIDSELTAKLLGRGVAVSPVVTVEPRRRKFHKAITLSMPAPRPHTQGMTNQYSTSSAPTLRLLCSISGGTNRAHWEDVTENTPLTFVNDCVSFTTTVSARYWLIDCRHVEDATKMATELYREAIHVPFMARFVVYAKRSDQQQAQIRMFCITDDKEDKTLERIERFAQVAKSRDVEVHEGKPCYLEFAGNLVPVAKSGEQLSVPFKAFRENRLAFPVMVKSAHVDPVARCQFMREPKVPKGEPSPAPICVLNITIPEETVEVIVERSTTPVVAYTEDQELIWRQRLSDPRLEDICNLLGKDWVALAYELGVSIATVNQIQAKRITAPEQAQLMLKLWKTQSGTKAQDNALELALCRIGRDDIIAPQSEVMNERRIQRNIYQEKQASIEIEAYKAEGDNKLKEKLYDDNQISEYVRPESEHVDHDEAKYSPEEKSVEKSELDRTPTPSEESEEDEDVKRSVAERKEQITRKLSSSKIPASKQKKELREEIIEIKTQIKPDIKKFHDIEQKQQVKEKEQGKLERTRSKTSPESFEEEVHADIKKEEQKPFEKPLEQFRKFDPSSPAKPTPKHLQRHVRNDSMRFPSGDFSNVTITPRKSITADSVEVKHTIDKQVTEHTSTILPKAKDEISQKEINTSQFEEKSDEISKSPDLVMEDESDKKTFQDKISSFESKTSKGSSAEQSKATVKLTKEALKKHTLDQDQGYEYTQEFVREQSKQIANFETHTNVKEIIETELETKSEIVKSVKETIQHFDLKSKQEHKKASVIPKAIRTDSTLVQVSSEEDNEFLKKSTDSETETESQNLNKAERQGDKDLKSSKKKSDVVSKIPVKCSTVKSVKIDKDKQNIDKKVKDDNLIHKYEDTEATVTKIELKETTTERVLSQKVESTDILLSKNGKVKIEEKNGSIESGKIHTKTDSVGSDLVGKHISQESSIVSVTDKADSLAELHHSTEKDESFISQTESKVYSKHRSDSLDEASQFSDLDDQIGTSSVHISTINDASKLNKEKKVILPDLSDTSTKKQTLEFLEYETQHAAQVHCEVSPKESPIISAKARQFIETVPEDDSVQECFFSKRIYSDSLEDSEHTDSRRHSEAESLKSDQSDMKAKVSASDFDERAEYEENIDSGSGFGDEKFEESIALTSIKLDTVSQEKDDIGTNSDKVEESDVIFKKMAPKRHSRTESVSLTKLSDIQLDPQTTSRQEFQIIVTEAEEVARSFDQDDPSDKISSESSREIEISDRKSSDGISDKISSEDAVTEKKTSSEEYGVKEGEFEQEKTILSSVKDNERVTPKFQVQGNADKRQSVTSTESTTELRLEEKRLSDAHSLTESRDYTFEESEDDIGAQVDIIKDKSDSKIEIDSKTRVNFGPTTVISKLPRLTHGDSLDDVEGFPEDHVSDHVHKLPYIAEVGLQSFGDTEKNVTSEFIAMEKEMQLQDNILEKNVDGKEPIFATKETVSTYSRTVKTTVSRDQYDITKDIPVLEEHAEKEETVEKTKFDIKKIRSDTLSKIKKPDDVKVENKNKNSTAIIEDDVKNVIDDIIHKGSIAAAIKSPNIEKDIISTISKDIVEVEKRSYDAKAVGRDERRHSCISPAISLERIAESDTEAEEEVSKFVNSIISSGQKTGTETIKKSDSAMKQMADNIEIIIKQASEDLDVSVEETLEQKNEIDDMANRVSVDSIIEQAVSTVEEYLESTQEKVEIEKDIKDDTEEIKKPPKDRPILRKSLSKDSGEIVIMPKKKQPRTFSVQSSPDEVEEQIYTDSESDMDKAKVLEIIEPSSDLEGQLTPATFDARKIRTDSLDDADDLFPEKEAEFFGDDEKYHENVSSKLSYVHDSNLICSGPSTSTENFKGVDTTTFNKNMKASEYIEHILNDDTVSKSTTVSSITTVISTLTKSSEGEPRSAIDDATSGDLSKISGADLIKDPSKASIHIKEEFSKVEEQAIDNGTPELSKKSLDLTKDYSKSSIDSKDTSRDFATNELSKDSTSDLTRDFSKASIESVKDATKSIDGKTFSEDHSLDMSKTLASDASEVLSTSHDTAGDYKLYSREDKASSSSSQETSILTESKILSENEERIIEKSATKIDAENESKANITPKDISDEDNYKPDVSELNRRCSNLLEDISQAALIRIDSTHVSHDIASKFSKTPPPSPVDLVLKDKAKLEESAAAKPTGLQLKGSDSSFLDASRQSPRISSAGDSLYSETEAHQSEMLTDASKILSAAATPKSPIRHLAENLSFVNVDQPTITSGAKELIDRTIEKSINVIDQIKQEQLAVKMEEMEKTSKTQNTTETPIYREHAENKASNLKFEVLDPGAMMSDLVSRYGSSNDYSTVISHKEIETKKISGQEYFTKTKQVSSSDDDSLIVKTETTHELRGQEHEIKEKVIIRKDGDHTETFEKKVEKAHEGAAKRSDTETKTVFKSNDDANVMNVQREFLEQGLYSGRQTKSEEKMTAIKDETTKRKHEVKYSERDLSHEQWGEEYFTEPGELEDIEEDDSTKQKIAFVESTLKIVEKDETFSSLELSEKGKIISSTLEHHKEESIIENKEHDDLSSDISHETSFKSDTVRRESCDTSPKSKSKSFKKDEVFEVDFIKEIKVSTSPVKSTFSRTGSQESHSESEIGPDLPHDDKQVTKEPINQKDLTSTVTFPHQPTQSHVLEASLGDRNAVEAESSQMHLKDYTTSKLKDGDKFLDLKNIAEIKTDTSFKASKSDYSPSTVEMSDDISTTSRDIMIKSGESIDTEFMIKSLESHEAEMLQKSIDSNVSAETLHPSEFSTEADSAFLTGTEHKKEELKLLKEKSLEDICSSGYDTDLSSAEFQASKLEAERLNYDSLISAQPHTDLSVLEKTIDEVKQSLEAAQVEIITQKNDGTSKYKQSPSEFQFKLLISPDRPEVIKEESQPTDEQVEIQIYEKKVIINEDSQTSGSLSCKATSQEDNVTSDEDKDTIQLRETSQIDSSDFSVRSDSGPHSILETESEVALSDKDSSSKGSPEVKLRVNKHIRNKLGVTERRSASEVEGWSSSGESHYQSFEHSDSRPLSSDVDVMVTAHSGTDFETALTTQNASSHSMRTSKDYYTAASSLASRDSMKSLDSDGSSHVASIDISDASETLVPSANELKEELMESSTYIEQFLHEKEIATKVKDVIDDDITIEDESNKTSCELIGKMKRSHEMRFQPKDMIPEYFPSNSVTESIDNDEDREVSDTTTISSQLKTDDVFTSSISKLDSQSDIKSIREEVSERIIKVSSHDDHAIPFNVTKGPREREFVDVEAQIISIGSDEYNKITKPQDKSAVSSQIREEDTLIRKTIQHTHESPSAINQVEVKEECIKKVVKDVGVTPFPVTEVPISHRSFVDIEDQIIPFGSKQYEEVLKSQSDSSVPKTTIEKSTVKTPDSTLDDSKKSSTSSLKSHDHLSASHTPLSAPSQSSLSTDNGREYVLDDIYDISETPELKSEMLTEGTSSRSELVITTEEKQLHAYDKDQDSPISDEFELIEKPNDMDDFIVIEEVAKEAQETDTEGKSLHIKQQIYIKKHDIEVEEYLSNVPKKQDSSSASGSLSDEEMLQYELEQKKIQTQELAEVEAGKRWMQTQFEGDPRYDYERVPLEDIKEEEMTDFDASRIGSLTSQKESVGSYGSFKNSYGSLSESEMISRLRFRVRGENDDISISSLQEFENLEKALMDQYQQQSSSSQDSLNGSLPRRYILSKSQGDDVSVSSLKEFEGLESACLEALKAEILAKQKEALLLSQDPKELSYGFLEHEKRSYSGSSESSPPQKSGSPGQKSGSPSQKSGSPSQKSGSPSQKGVSYGSPSQKILAESAAIRKFIDQALEQKAQDKVLPKIVMVKKFDDKGAFFIPEIDIESTTKSEVCEMSDECKKVTAFICAAAPKDGSAESIPGDCEEMMKILDQEETNKRVHENKIVRQTVNEGGTVEVVRTTTVIQQKFVDGKKVSEIVTSLEGDGGIDIPSRSKVEYDLQGVKSFESEMSSSLASQQSDLDSLATVVEKNVTDDGFMCYTKQTVVMSTDKPDDLELSRDSMLRELSPSSTRSVTHSVTSFSGKHVTDPASGSWSGQDEELSSSGSFSRARADLMLGSTDSLEATSSNATRATYNYEVDTPMTGSLTSGGSNTMVSSLDTLDPVTTMHMESMEHVSTSEHYSHDYDVHEPDSDTERLELDGRAPRAKERTIMFDSTDTLSAVSGDGSVKEAVVETAAPTFYIGERPILRGEKSDDEELDQPQLSGSCPASLPPALQESPPIPAQRSCYCLSHSYELLPGNRSLTTLARSPPTSLDIRTPKK